MLIMKPLSAVCLRSQLIPMASRAIECKHSRGDVVYGVGQQRAALLVLENRQVARDEAALRRLVIHRQQRRQGRPQRRDRCCCHAWRRRWQGASRV